VHNSCEENFAGRLVQRLGPASFLTDAATGHTISSSELPRLIRGFAAGLLNSGLRPGDRLLVRCEITPASTIAYLGAIYSGIVPVPIEERLFAASGEQLVSKAQVKAIWSAKPAASTIGGLLNLCGLFAPNAGSIGPHPSSPADLAALMPTSGSTGMPRLVMVSHGNLTANTEAIIRSQQLGADEKAMLIMPISYCFGASVMHTHLYQGGGVVYDSRFMFPDKVLHAIGMHGCTSFAGVPVVYNVLLRRSNLKSIPLPGLRRFLQAGGALPPENVEEITRIVPNALFFVMYGQTEATARISCLPAARLQEKLGSAGFPLDNIEIRIVDENEKEVESGQVGEVQARGPSICLGYLDDPEATAKKFAAGWLRTGDFACRDQEGYLWIKGRTDDFIKIRGVRVSVGEVEAKVGAMVGVSECAAVGVKHPEAGEALALLVVAEACASGKLDLGENIRRALPPHWTCVSVKIVPQLPRTSNGKIARSQLAALI